MRFATLTAFVLLAALPSQALAWGKTGHRVVAALAEQRLSGLARAQIHEIMGPEGLVEASVLPDFNRSDPSVFWQKTSPPWHYVTLNGVVYDEVPESGDALTALKRFTDILKDPSATRADKKLALEFIVHLVGDLHQPMHAGKCCDRGGNSIKVTWFGKPSNLHSVWDVSIIEEEGLSYSELAAMLNAHIGDRMAIDWWDINPQDWVSESAQLRDTLYPPPAAGKKPPALGYDYVYRWTGLANRRLSQAGVRLAAYLNAVYATPQPSGVMP